MDETPTKASRLVAHYKAIELATQEKSSVDRRWRIWDGDYRMTTWDERLAKYVESLGGRVEDISSSYTWNTEVLPDGFDMDGERVRTRLIDPATDADASFNGGAFTVFTPVAMGTGKHLERCAQVEALYARHGVKFEKNCVTEHGSNVCQPVPRALIEAALSSPIMPQ